MTRRSPTLEGFRAMFRGPTVPLAEIAWRWSFGGAAALLTAFGFVEYLDTLPVSAGDLFLLRTRHPFLVSQAMAHIVGGSAQRAVQAFAVLALTMALAWIVLASWSRAAILAQLREYFQQGKEEAGKQKRPLRALLVLNFLRAVAALAGVLGFVAAFLLAGAVSPDSDPSPGAAFLVFLAVGVLLGAAWVVVNWILSLAAVFTTEEEDAFGALAAAVGLCRDHAGPMAAATTWFGLAHIVAFVLATSVVAFPLAFAGLLPAGIVLGGVLLVTVAYFFVVDFLYAGRLASYVYIASGPPPAEVLAGTAPAPGPRPVPQNVDRNEVILSDVPLAPEAGG